MKVMQAVQVIAKKDAGGVAFSLEGVGGTLGRWLARVFGCWHMEMGRPRTLGGETYRACLDCGAHRRFDAHRWEMKGEYYYAAPVPAELYAIETRAARPAKRQPVLLKVAA
jgi:hypothetical protein